MIFFVVLLTGGAIAALWVPMDARLYAIALCCIIAVVGIVAMLCETAVKIFGPRPRLPRRRS